MMGMEYFSSFHSSFHNLLKRNSNKLTLENLPGYWGNYAQIQPHILNLFLSYSFIQLPTNALKHARV